MLNQSVREHAERERDAYEPARLRIREGSLHAHRSALIPASRFRLRLMFPERFVSA
jgi:hypothetical protein